MVQSPHTITIDTLRKNAVIRKSDLAIVTEKKSLPAPQIIEQKPRLIHMVACKTVGECKRNQEKIQVLFRRSQETEDHGMQSIIVQEEHQVDSR